jgi:cell division protein FtsW (lipid II flippase)
MSPYRRLRVQSFLNPWADPAQKGFQVIQSMLSFYSGGLTGVGLGQGQGKLFFLPEAHTDFTLAVLGEEMGFVGFFILLMVFGFMVFRGFQVALRLKLLRERALALSFSLLLTFSVFHQRGRSSRIAAHQGVDPAVDQLRRQLPDLHGSDDRLVAESGARVGTAALVPRKRDRVTAETALG